MEGHSVRVLLLDGDRLAADQMIAMIQEGADSDMVCESIDRIDQAARRLAQGKIDVVLANPFRCGCNDRDPFKELRTLAPGVPILAITGQADNASRFDTGVVDCFIKEPLNTQTIRRAIRTTLERHRFQKFLQTSQLRFEKIISSDLDAILILDGMKCVRYVNRAGEVLFGRQAHELVGSVFDYPLLNDRFVEIEIRRDEIAVAVAEICVAEIEWEGDSMSLVSLRDITDRKAMEASARETTRELEDTIRELNQVNQRVLDQQRSVIEEERLNLLLQIAGATAHELNQPLMALLGSIDLMRINQDKPDQLARNIDRIQEAGQQITDIVKKIQLIQRDETKPYLRDSVIINLDQKLKVLCAIDSDDEFDRLEAILARHPRIEMTRMRTATDASVLLGKEHYDLILIDSSLPNRFGADLLRCLCENVIDTPVVVMTAEGEEMTASGLIAAGAYDYLPKAQMTAGALNRVITNVQEKLRLQREVEEVRRQMARQTVTDGQTGLHNRRYFMEMLDREMSRARRYGPVLVVGLIEPEERQLVSADQRDARSSAVISMLGRLLRRQLRKSDFICRYSATTIAVIFPHTDADALRNRLEVLRQKVAGQPFEYEGKALNLVLNIGISPFNSAEVRLASEFVKQAESALAAAKKRDEVYAMGVG